MTVRLANLDSSRPEMGHRVSDAHSYENEHSYENHPIRILSTFRRTLLWIALDITVNIINHRPQLDHLEFL